MAKKGVAGQIGKIFTELTSMSGKIRTLFSEISNIKSKNEKTDKILILFGIAIVVMFIFVIFK